MLNRQHGVLSMCAVLEMIAMACSISLRND